VWQTDFCQEIPGTFYLSKVRRDNKDMTVWSLREEFTKETAVPQYFYSGIRKDNLYPLACRSKEWLQGFPDKSDSVA
jgi:hypothetical protein